MPKLPRSTSSATSSMASGPIPSHPAKPHPDRLKIMHLFPDRPLGKRRGFGEENLAPYDLTMAVVGTGLLGGGWFGFNGGSALSAGPRACMAILVTHLAACAGALT